MSVYKKLANRIIEENKKKEKKANRSLLEIAKDLGKVIVYAEDFCGFCKRLKEEVKKNNLDSHVEFKKASESPLSLNGIPAAHHHKISKPDHKDIVYGFGGDSLSWLKNIEQKYETHVNLID